MVLRVNAWTLQKEGFLTKRGGKLKNWRRRWVVMREGFLYYYKYKNGGQEKKGCISLYGCRIETSNEIPKDQLGFQLITKTRGYHMYADSDLETQVQFEQKGGRYLSFLSRIGLRPSNERKVRLRDKLIPLKYCNIIVLQYEFQKNLFITTYVVIEEQLYITIEIFITIYTSG